LSGSVLAQFGQMLDQFDAAVKLGKEGRTAHKGAVLELRTVATLIGRTVRVMDARNRQRFQDDRPGGVAQCQAGARNAERIGRAGAG
jgi:hypothetical protein